MSQGITGNIKHSNGLITTHKRNNELANINRRRPKSGYPVNTPFRSKEEIKNYLSQDRIECLMCGHLFKSLVTHLDKIHAMSTDQYREKYGLPYSIGLTCTSTKEKKSIFFKNLIEEGKCVPNPDCLQYRKRKPRLNTIFYRLHAITNLGKSISKNSKRSINKNTLKVWSESDYYRVLDLALEHSVMPVSIMNDERFDVPKRSSFGLKMQKNKKLKNAYYNTIEKLPIEVQAHNQMLGKKARNMVSEMRTKGFSNQNIAEKLKISIGSVANLISELSDDKKIKMFCYRGHPYNDKRKCKECETINRRNKGELPRKVAAATIIEKPCEICGNLYHKSKIGIGYCEQCRHEKYLQSQKKYAENNREKRRHMARIAYINRKKMNSESTGQSYLRGISDK